MKRLVFATTNAGKRFELMALLEGALEVVGPEAFPNIPEVVEDAESFAGNALKKARVFAEATGLPALADDSGLCVDALDGRPGVHSARYAPTDAARIIKLLAELQAMPRERRTARFKCALALVKPDGWERSVQGLCEGRIAIAPRGQNGFGYDPIFELPDGRTMAELTREEKAKVSHRGQAFVRLRPALLDLTKD